MNMDKFENCIDIQFGLGKVLVGVFCNSLVIELIEKPQIIGSKMCTETEALKTYTIPFYNLSDLCSLQDLTKEVYNGVKFIRYKNYIFNFSNYNIESVNIFYEHLSHVKENLMHLVAV